MSNWSSLPLQKTWQSNAGPSSQKSSYTHELYIGLWLARDVRESSSVASSRHREHTQGIKGLRVPPDVLTFSLLFFCFFSFQWPVGGGGAPLVENGHRSQLEKVPPSPAASVVRRRPEAGGWRLRCLWDGDQLMRPIKKGSPFGQMCQFQTPFPLAVANQ
jgi:hypothetical protein